MQAYSNLPQPRWNKVFPCPLLNSMKRKSLVGVSATLFAKHECREAVSAPPLIRSRHTTLAHHCHRDTFRTEEAIQVGADPRNKIFYVGMLGLRASQMTLRKGMMVSSLSFVQGHPHLSIMAHLHPWIEGQHRAVLAILLPGQLYPFQQSADFLRCQFLQGSI